MTACIRHHERNEQPLLLAGSYHHVYSGQKPVAWQARSESVFLHLASMSKDVKRGQTLIGPVLGAGSDQKENDDRIAMSPTSPQSASAPDSAGVVALIEGPDGFPPQNHV